MPGPLPWERLTSERLQDCRVFRVERVIARSPNDGATHDFFCIDSAEWVNIVATTRDEKLVMVRQFRHGSERITLEIPGGMVDPGEDPKDTAARELLEETGYRPERVIPIGAVNPNPALFRNRVHTYLAEHCVKVAEVQNTGAEETVVKLVPIADIAALVQSGAIDHALVLAGLYQWELMRRTGGS